MKRSDLSYLRARYYGGASSGLRRDRIFLGKGLCRKTDDFRGNRSYESYFINGRYIKSALLSKAVEEAYKGLYDAASVSVLRAVFYHGYGLLDVNVHPTKMELRFSNNEEVYRKLYQTIRDVLTHKGIYSGCPGGGKERRKASGHYREPAGAV